MIWSMLSLWLALAAGVSRTQAPWSLRYVQLRIAVDLAAHRIDGVAQLDVAGPARASTLRLDLSDSVTLDSARVLSPARLAAVTGTRDSGAVTFAMLAGTEPARVRVAVWYHGKPARQAVAFAPNAARVASYGVPRSAREWWPTLDDPAQKADSADIWITAPAQLVAVSNGRQASRMATDDAKIAMTHWTVRHPVYPDAISFAVADYTVATSTLTLAGKRRMPFAIYAFPEDSAKAGADFADVPRILSFYEEKLGPYPFADEKYALVEFGRPSFREGQTLSHIGANMFAGTRAHEEMFAHEIAHQWFGNSLTVRRWDDMWLNESLSEYMAWQWVRHSRGDSAFRSLVDAGMRADVDAPIVPASAGNFKSLFGNATFAKGPAVLVMLEREIGTAAFATALHRYVASHTYGLVETADFQRACEQASGKSLDPFFAKWIRGKPPAAVPDSLAAHSIGAWGVDLSDRDPAVKPGDDLFKSQNGGWLARKALNTAEPAAAYWRDLRRLWPRRISALVAEAAADRNASPESVRGKAGAFYRAYMDETTIESRGLTPLAPELAAIRAATTRAAIATLMGRESATISTVFGLAIGQDQQHPDRNVVYVGQAGLELPGNEYYLDPQQADIKAGYQAYVGKMLALLGWPNAESRAADIVAFETRLAGARWDRQAMSRADKTYNATTVSELATLAPSFDWRAFLAGAGLANVTRVVVDAKAAFPALASIVAETPIDVLQARQAFALIDRGAPNLNAAAVEANFDFRVKAFNSGQLNTLPPRDGFRAGTLLDAAIGPMLGTLYVERYVTPDVKPAALAMIANLRKALDARLARNTWMTPETRAKARAKLARMRFNVGYPDKPENYSALVVSDTDLYGDFTRTAEFLWRRQIKRLDSLVDRSAWVVSPQTVNYNYIPTTNVVEIPAGLLQPPFFDPHAGPAVNYGAAGVLIGQMMLAAFDDAGRHYDVDGRLRDWWTPAETKHFEAEMRRIAEQYTAVEALPGIHVRGELVANEAADDLGAWLTALDAYHLSLARRPAPTLDGFAGDQRVFLGRAQMWRAKFAVPFLRAQVVMAGNSPTFLRVNGPARNMDAWYAAFDVRPGDRLYLAPEDRVRIW